MAIERKSILWMIIIRLIVVLTLFLSTLIIESTAPFLPPLVPFYVLIAAALVLSAVYLALYRLSRNTLFQAYLQIVLDLVIVTGLVYMSGGLSGSFYFLYVFVILAGGVILPARSAYFVAAMAAVFFGFMVDGIYYELIPGPAASQQSAFAPGYVLFTVLMAWAVFFVIAFLIDRLVGNLRRAGEHLRRAQKQIEIQERLASAGQQAASLAHEIRNPLAAIAGSVQALKGEVVLDADQARLMEIVLKESRRVSQTIDQFLSLASPERVVFADMNLAELLQETLTILRTGGELDSGIQVEANYDRDGLTFYGNSDQFRQIFWNLAKNAVKAMPQGGRLTVDLLKPAPAELRIRFADTGRGMTEAERNELFVPFRSGFGAGWGLGMALVRRIVEDYEGRIEVDSAPGRGTAITLIFPARGGAGRTSAAL